MSYKSIQGTSVKLSNDSEVNMDMDMDNMDIPSRCDISELMNSEFFDSVLSLEQENSINSNDVGMLSSLDEDLLLDCRSSCDVDEVQSTSTVSSGSDNSNWTSAATNENFEYSVNSMQAVDHDMFMSLLSSKYSNLENVGQEKKNKVLIHNPNVKKVILTKPYNSMKKSNCKSKQQMLRVQSLSGRGKPILLPFNLENVKSIKIFNARNFREQSIQLNTPTSSYPSKIMVPEDVIEEDGIDVSSEDNPYPPLNLTSEEKRLLLKDGIQLPTHYPLTKNEERELKRIRRKIRNKVSAQDSRKRKKEYVDGLEERVKRGTEENKFLLKRVKQLQKQNSSLMEQMSKLQALVFNSGSSKATPTTCLMIVLFSALLVALPNVGISNSKELGDQQQVEVAARRALLFKQDDESDLENSTFSEAHENENATEKNIFGKLLQDYDISLDKINCSAINSERFGKLLEYCTMYENDIQNAINTMKNYFEKEVDGLNERNAVNSKIDYGGTKNKNGFIEPDIDYVINCDVEGGEKCNPVPTKKMKLDVNDINFIDFKEKFAPMIHEVKEEILSAIVGKNSFAINVSETK